MFKNRQEAAVVLAEKLLKYKDEEPVIIALPRGGVPVGYEIARKLKAKLDIIIVRKLGAPGNEELAIGALVEAKEPQALFNDEIVRMLGVSQEYIDKAIARQTQEIQRRQNLYRHGETITDVNGRVVIIVDDGIATGATMRSAIKALRSRKPKKIVVAVPVAPADTIEVIKREADEVVVLQVPEIFYAVGAHYEDFAQTTDEEVVVLLRLARDFGVKSR